MIRCGRSPVILGGVRTTFFDTLLPITPWWMDRAVRFISNWNTDGSAEIIGAKACSAHVTHCQVILYDKYGNKIYTLGGTR